MTAPEIGSAAPDPVLLERFSQALERMWPEEGRLGLAVSGGPDSLALLLLGAAAIPGKFEVATVDHGLRAESAAECAMVAQVCATLDVPCAILKVQVARGNVQSAGRQARYAALAAWAETRGLDALATAHHADDQVETLVMRLNRGSGLRGLAGIRERTVLHDSGTVLIRPLLGFTQQELAKIVSAAALVPAKDPSNADARYTRARLRQALAGANWVEPAGWVQSAAHLAEMERLLELMIGREWIECVEHTDGELRYAALRTGLPGVNAVRIGVIQSAARLLTGRQIDTAAAADMVQSLIRGRTCNAAGMLGRVADLGGERLWLFQPEPPRRALDQGVAHIGSLAVGDDDLVPGFGDGEQLGDKRIG